MTCCYKTAIIMLQAYALLFFKPICTYLLHILSAPSSNSSIFFFTSANNFLSFPAQFCHKMPLHHQIPPQVHHRLPVPSPISGSNGCSPASASVTSSVSRMSHHHHGIPMHPPPPGPPSAVMLSMPPPNVAGVNAPPPSSHVHIQSFVHHHSP